MKRQVTDRKNCLWDFPGSPVVTTSPCSEGGAGLIPGWGAKILYTLWPKNQNIQQQQKKTRSNLVTDSIKT